VYSHVNCTPNSVFYRLPSGTRTKQFRVTERG